MKKQIRLQLIWVFFFGAMSFGAYAQVQIGGTIDGEAAFEDSGVVSLSSDGSVLAIGAPGNDENGEDSGHVRVYKKIMDVQSPSGFNWEQLGDAIDGEAAGDWSGFGVSLSSDGRVLAIGAPLAFPNRKGPGYVRVYEKVVNAQSPGGFKWEQIGDAIDGDAAGDASGESVSLSSDGSVLAIGAPNNNENGTWSGHVRVYERDASDNWVQLGDDIDGEAEHDRSGSSVSLSSDGSVLAIGARGNDGKTGRNSGHVRVYKKVEDALSQGSFKWQQLGEDIDGEAEGDQSGIVSLSSDGSVLAIGAQSNDGKNGTWTGHVRVYGNNGGTWKQIGDDIDGEAARDWSGSSVSLSSNGNVLAIGAWGNDEKGDLSGHVRVYGKVEDASSPGGFTWEQIGGDIDGEAAGDRSGRVSLSSDGSVLAIGAPGNVPNVPNADFPGYTRVYYTGAGVSIQGVPAAVDTTDPFEVIFAFDRRVTDFNKEDIVVTHATIDNFTTVDDSTYTATVTPISICDNIAINVPTGAAFDDVLNISNFAAQQVIVEVVDDVPPNARAKDITVALGANGQVILNADQINDNSTDNCGVEAMFIGSNQVISSEGTFDVELIVEDVNGNRASDFARVTVVTPTTVSIGNAPSGVEDLSPFTTEIVFSRVVTGFELADMQVTNATVRTLTGSGSTYVATIAPTSLCDGHITIDVPANVAESTTTGLPNLASTQLSVNVVDTMAPTITCLADVVANTADNGTDDCTATVNLGSPTIDDNCSVASVVTQVNGTDIDPDSYAFATGTTTVTWIVSDGSGNSTSCEQTVTVHDDEGSIAICQDITVQLDADGNKVITANDIDNASYDNCGIGSLAIDKDTFDCSDIGVNTVALTVTDINGNTATCLATVTVEAGLYNLVAVARDITVQLDTDGEAIILPVDVDNGSGRSGCNNSDPIFLSLDKTTFSCNDVGTPVTVVLMVTQGDETATATALVTVEAAGNCESSPSLSAPMIPTAFTPNGDGANDHWIIDNLSGDATVRIYDRHGTTLFRSDNGYTRPWDGTSRGSSLPTGSYLYAIQNGSHTYRGIVTILL